MRGPVKSTVGRNASCGNRNGNSSGNTAAFELVQNDHDVVVYEKGHRAGGHANTVEIDCGARRISVDTGFVVYNERNYPNFSSLLRQLGVITAETSMSFSVSEEFGRFEWCARSGSCLATLNGLFAQRSNVLSLPFYLMLTDIIRFNKRALEDFQRSALDDLLLRDYLASGGFSRRFLNYYLLPLAAAIWSCTSDEVLEFPASNFVGFLKNHQLLQNGQASWRTVVGGSRNYVERLTMPFRDKIRFGVAVKAITRMGSGVTIIDDRGERETVDQVIIATHADQALAILSDATAQERTILGAIRFHSNRVLIHGDRRLMPKRPAAWASWNVMRCNVDAKPHESVTYWMNLLQKIDLSFPLYVTLNPPFEPVPNLVYSRLTYDHPHFTRDAVSARENINSIQGMNWTWFCGAWTGFGFHEDGTTAGLSVVRRINGLSAPITNNVA